jgi:hypothetical protein
MMTYLSGDARKIQVWLQDRGIALEEPVSLEYTCSVFFPNHIIGVCDHVLSKGDIMGKLERAQDQGWSYFEKPIWSILEGRETAHRRKRPWPKLPPRADAAWRVVQARLLLSDMSRDDADLLLFAIPEMADKLALSEAIRVCRERDIRTVAYLHGILRRRQQERQGKQRERRESGGDPWTPPAIDPIEIADAARFEYEWGEILRDVDIERGLREIDKE